MDYLKECLYDVEWQRVRQKLNGKWQADNGVRQSLAYLNLYWSRNEPGKPERVWRALRYLDVVQGIWRMRAGPPSGWAEEAVMAMQLDLTRVSYKQDEAMGTVWDWNKVQTDLQLTDRRYLVAIASDIAKQCAYAKRRYGSEEEVEQRRPELAFFYKLLSIELDRRDGKPTTYLLKVATKRSPYMQQFRGYRILCAVPNMAGHKPFSSEPAPSFDRPYALVQFGDFADDADLNAALAKVPKEMELRGFNTCVEVE